MSGRFTIAHAPPWRSRCRLSAGAADWGARQRAAAHRAEHRDHRGRGRLGAARRRDVPGVARREAASGSTRRGRSRRHGRSPVSPDPVNASTALPAWRSLVLTGARRRSTSSPSPDRARPCSAPPGSRRIEHGDLGREGRRHFHVRLRDAVAAGAVRLSRNAACRRVPRRRPGHGAHHLDARFRAGSLAAQGPGARRGRGLQDLPRRPAGARQLAHRNQGFARAATRTSTRTARPWTLRRRLPRTATNPNLARAGAARSPHPSRKEPADPVCRQAARSPQPQPYGEVQPPAPVPRGHEQAPALFRPPTSPIRAGSRPALLGRRRALPRARVRRDREPLRQRSARRRCSQRGLRSRATIGAATRATRTTPPRSPRLTPRYPGEPATVPHRRLVRGRGRAGHRGAPPDALSTSPTPAVRSRTTLAAKGATFRDREAERDRAR